MKPKPQYRDTINSVLGILNKAAEKELGTDKAGSKKPRRQTKPRNKPEPRSG